MVSKEDWESNEFFFLRTLSFARIVLFGIATVVQLFVLIECYMTSMYCNVFIVLVPPLLIFVDVGMMRWSRELEQWFYLGQLVVSLGFTGVGLMGLFRIINTGFLFPSIQLIMPSTIDEYIIRIISYGVIIVSLIQVMLLIYLTRPQKLEQIVDEEDDWLSDADQ